MNIFIYWYWFAVLIFEGLLLVVDVLPRFHYPDVIRACTGLGTCDLCDIPPAIFTPNKVPLKQK